MENEFNSVPFFSVVITTYNRCELLERALNSLLYQTEKDWEAIIIDDGSTDGTDRYISSYIKSYPQIRYFRHTRRGAPLSKNAGIQLASGRYITFLDSDDEFHPTHLHHRKKVLSNNPAIKLLYGGALIIGDQLVPDRKNPSKQINLSECVIGGTFFIERETAMLLKGFKNLPISEDAELFERIRDLNLLSMEVTEPTYIYHHETQNSITHQFILN